jgi:hypothetical protein
MRNIKFMWLYNSSYVTCIIQDNYAVEIRAVICCWPSPAQSFSVSDFIGTDDYIFVHSKTLSGFEMGPPLRREEGSTVVDCSPLIYDRGNEHFYKSFEVFKAAILQIIAFWVAVPCSLVVGGMFGGTPPTSGLNCVR